MTDDSTLLHAIAQYQAAGWLLVPIEPGTKAPRGVGWNVREACRIPTGWAGGLGLAHAYSGTCAIDLDQLKAAARYLEAEGIDPWALLGAPDVVMVSSGRPDRAKLLYRLPEGVEALPTVAILGEDRHHMLQFRCATRGGLTVQDLLPPSVHPDTGEPYEWAGRGDWRALPELPAALLALWRRQLDTTRGRRMSGARGPVRVDDIVSALRVLDPDMGRDDWYRVGMALHSTGEDLEWLWDEWSSRGAKYAGESDTRAVWNSFHDMPEGEGVGLGTLFWSARSEGWRGNIDIEALFAATRPTHVAAENGGEAGPTSPDAQPAAAAATLDELLVEVQGLNPSSGVGELLARAVWLTPTEQDRLIAEVSTLTTRNRTALRDELRQLSRAARRLLRDRSGGGSSDAPLFPLVNPETDKPLDHVANLEAICAHERITITYDEMRHQIEVNAGVAWMLDNWRNQQVAYVRDLMVRWAMPYQRSLEHISTIACQHAFHPLRQDLDQVQWDGVSRWDKVKETIKTTHTGERDLYLRKWCVSVIAAVRGWERGVPPRGVLCFSGEQALGKTSWLKYLTPRGMFGEGLMLDPSDKDSLKQAVSWLVVELGELDSTFSKADLSRIKAHISKGFDEIRLPYAVSESQWTRRTVYAGTVNQVEFLADQTGNTRFWPIEVSGFDLDVVHAMHDCDELMQYWAEVDSWYKAGEQWWLTPAELKSLEQHNEQFREHTAWEEVLAHMYQWGVEDRDRWTWRTTAEIIQDCRLTASISNNQHNDLHTALRRLTGSRHARKARIGGMQARRWLVPPRTYELRQGGKEGEE